MKLNKTLREVKAVRSALAKLSRDNTNLPKSIRDRIKTLETDLFVQSCKIEEALKDSPQYITVVAKAS